MSYTIVPATQAQVGDIILQGDSFDLMSLATWVHSLMLGEKPRFTHCGIYVGAGQMITAAGKVTHQDAGAANSIAARYAWADLAAVLAWLDLQLGKPYDYLALLLCVISPFMRRAFPQTYLRYTCSSLVAAAILHDSASAPEAFYQRTVAPDDVARYLGA